MLKDNFKFKLSADFGTDFSHIIFNAEKQGGECGQYKVTWQDKKYNFGDEGTYYTTTKAEENVNDGSWLLV